MLKVEDLELYVKTSMKKQIFAQDTKPALVLDNIWIDTTTAPYAIYRCDGTSYIQIGSASSISDLTSFTTDNLAESATKKYVSPTQITNWDNKIDKVAGKSLIADSEITRLSTVSNYDHSAVDAHMANNNIHISPTDRTKLDGINANASKVESSTTNGNIKINGTETNVYTHPATHDASMIIQDSTHKMVTDAQINKWDNKLDVSNIKQGNNITITTTGNDITISSTAGGGASIDDTNVSTTSSYSSSKLLSITGDINDTGLPANMQGKTIIEMLKANFTNANEAKSLIINAIGDTSLATTNSFEEISNFLILKKRSIVNALANKGIVAADYEDIVNYATYINSIVQSSQLKNTKLNKTSGSTYSITLTNPTTIQNICTSVLEHKDGATGVVQYDCDFNNSDSTSFNIDASQHLIFDGTMKQDNNTSNITMTNDGAVGTYTAYSAIIDKTKFNKISTITESNLTGNETITVNGTYNPILVQANSDISLVGVESIAKISWTAIATNTSRLLLAYSIDSGITWNGYDSVNHVVLPISDITNSTEVRTKGMSATNINSLSLSDLSNIRNNSSKIRFAYYFEKNSATDTVANDKITISVNMSGTDIFSTHYSLAFDGVNTITYTFTANGTYTIVYVDNN